MRNSVKLSGKKGEKGKAVWVVKHMLPSSLLLDKKKGKIVKIPRRIKQPPTVGKM